MIAFLLITALLLCVLHCYFKYNSMTRAIRQVPVPREDFLLGNAFDMITTPVKIFILGRRYAKTFDGIYGLYSFLIRMVNIYNPEDVETVISTYKNNEKSIAYRGLRPWLREGLLLSKGSKWLHRRKILTPAFHFNILKRFLVTIEENSQRIVESLKKTNSLSVDVIPLMSEYTINGICETAMGTRLHDETSDEGNIYKKSIHQLGRLCIERVTRIYHHNDLVFSLSNRGKEFYKHLSTVTSFTKRIIKERKEYVEENGINFTDSIHIEEDEDDLFLSRKKRIAMLDLMISAEKEGVIDSLGIQEEVDTFMFAGQDTASAGLSFCLMVLANHKEIQAKIVKELDETFGETNRFATIDDLNAMKYLECCIKESMRLYPPVPFIGRTLSEPVVLSGYTIPAGTYCNIHIYDLHRCENLYKDPEVYNPDRFLPENSVGRHPYAYIPFSAGPRNCIGQKFAMLEMKSCVAQILRRFELQPVTTPEDIEIAADVVLRSTKPIYVKFVERIN